MKTRKIAILSFCAVAVVATIIGLCFLFFGNKTIKDVPEFVSVEEIDGEIFVVTQYNGEYNYQFKLEQMMQGDYVTIKTVNSKVNTIKLSDNDIEVVFGETYRFSACYATENGAGNGAYRESEPWEAKTKLRDRIDYSAVEIDDVNKVITWSKVSEADAYLLRFVSATGEVLDESTEELRFSYEELPVGEYTLYIIAGSYNSSIEVSDAGEGIGLRNVKQNEIVEATRNLNGDIFVTCTQEVEKFEIYVDGQLKLTLDAGEKNETYYMLQGAKTLFKMIDEESVVEIKSMDFGCVLASEMALIKKTH